MRVETGAAPLALFAACAVALGPASAATAATATGGQEASPAQTIAAALEESPVYVDPSFESALPQEVRSGMAADIEESGVPLRVVVVPLVEGDQWGGDSEALAAAVHDRMGEPGHFLVISGNGADGADYPPPGTPEAEKQRAFYGALAASYATDYSAPMAEEAEKAVEFALADDPEAAYTEQQEAFEAEDTEGSDGSEGASEDATGEGSSEAGESAPAEGAGVWPWTAGAAVLLLAAGGGAYLLWYRPRRLPEPPRHTAFDNVDRARRDELQERAERELVEVGERISAQDAVSGEAAAAAMAEALDAHAAARSVLDSAPEGDAGLADLAGVLVLLDKAEHALARAKAGGRGRERRHCYANPLHGTATADTDWRELGSDRTVRVPMCKACAKSVRTRMRPEPLLVEHEGRTVPYYDVPAEESVWSATGFGTLTDDLVARIQRGEHTRGA
ncbi:hypothetical protein O4J56_19360 [Nocardiopsis sp. RSe5-2]|uniref:TPM domain-containing protein n=1 Tax=Nocardiopsis endophytica TaxID=3018445 RepID=A0ABT4U779_9ACTN|nr:hypothetical protein [Nocardiopsis endophytica]MDA2812812.1 hypothetical protein [Nocardiopsis endophytica]